MELDKAMRKASFLSQLLGMWGPTLFFSHRLCPSLGEELRKSSSCHFRLSSCL